MRSTFWKIKNSYAAKARADLEAKERARRDTVRSRQNNDDSLIASSIQEDTQELTKEHTEFSEQIEARVSNF